MCFDTQVQTTGRAEGCSHEQTLGHESTKDTKRTKTRHPQITQISQMARKLSHESTKGTKRIRTRCPQISQITQTRRTLDPSSEAYTDDVEGPDDVRCTMYEERGKSTDYTDSTDSRTRDNRQGRQERQAADPDSSEFGEQKSECRMADTEGASTHYADGKNLSHENTRGTKRT